jgi:peptidoglycan/xylan/chitin deacetylase (PgdA/CDA1 family)
VNDAGVPILMYHEVSPRPHPAFRRYTVTPRSIARQKRWLAAFKYRPIDMDTLIQARLGLAPLPKRPLVITFDDGLQGSVDHAVPVLRAHGFTAVFYLVAGLMGETSRWLRPELGMDLPIMSWDTARTLAASGFQCGAHTVTHPRLSGLDPSRRRAELVDARNRLEQELDLPVLHLAYPYGSFDADVQRAASEAGYLTACSTRTGFSGPDDDQLALQRVPIYGGETLADFACRLQTARALPERIRLALRDTARRVIRRPGFMP